jgi:hypothetical protein
VRCRKADSGVVSAQVLARGQPPPWLSGSRNSLRVSFNGRTSPFQGDDAGSSPVTRSSWWSSGRISARHAEGRGSIPRHGTSGAPV